MRVLLFGLVATLAVGWSVPIFAQATTRPCGAEEAGPACLLIQAKISTLPTGRIFWHLDRFTSTDSAQAAAATTSVVVQSFGSAWLFTLASKTWRPKGGSHVSTVGPLPLAPARSYVAEYLRSIFTPGMTAPLHVHSGPEAFFAVSGDTCLETPAGIQIGRGPGSSLIIRAGPPMLLMAIGTIPRQGFALILHDARKSPTTLTQAWRPRGLCARQLSSDRAQKRIGN